MENRLKWMIWGYHCFEKHPYFLIKYVLQGKNPGRIAIFSKHFRILSRSSMAGGRRSCGPEQLSQPTLSLWQRLVGRDTRSGKKHDHLRNFTILNSEEQLFQQIWKDTPEKNSMEIYRSFILIRYFKIVSDRPSLFESSSCLFNFLGKKKYVVRLKTSGWIQLSRH